MFACLQGYDYVCRTKPSAATLGVPPYWQKVFLCCELLETYTTVVFLDSDACWHDVNKGLPPDFCRAGLHMAATTPAFKDIEINAGVFVCSGRKGRSIMTKWCGLFAGVQNMWSTTHTARGKEWKCKGPWAGKGYEQGELNAHLFDMVTLHKFGELNSYACSQQSRCVCKHFFWKHKQNISEYVHAFHSDVSHFLHTEIQ
jgi:hypothetical protein